MGNSKDGSVATAICPTIGSNIPNAPHEVPVEKAINPARINNMAGKNITSIFAFRTIFAK